MNSADRRVEHAPGHVHSFLRIEGAAACAQGRAAHGLPQRFAHGFKPPHVRVPAIHTFPDMKTQPGAYLPQLASRCSSIYSQSSEGAPGMTPEDCADEHSLAESLNARHPPRYHSAPSGHGPVSDIRPQPAENRRGRRLGCPPLSRQSPCQPART